MSTAFASTQHIGNTAVVTFHLQSDFNIPTNILQANVTQFQYILTFASSLIDFEV